MVTRAAADRSFKRAPAPLLAAAAALALSACGTLPVAGPSTNEVLKPTAESEAAAPYLLVDLDVHSLAKLPAAARNSLAATFGDRATPEIQLIKPGDYVAVTIWEVGSVAPLLGGAASADPGSAQHDSVPEQMVADNDGTVTIPYAGPVVVAGLTPAQAELSIRHALHGLVPDPQVLVTLTKNTSNQALVLGDDIKGLSFTLTPNADRLLDAVAAAGGVSSPTYQAQVKLTRGGRSVTVGLQDLMSTPAENIHLAPHDVLSVSKNPGFFTMLGAVGHDQQVQFQNEHMSLAEALGLAGGLLDERADPSGVFIFRYEPPALAQALCAGCTPPVLPRGVPVVYRLNMRHAGSFFVARDFQMADHDVVYVSNASNVQTAKFLSMLRDAFSPVLAGGVVIRDTER